MLLGDAWSPLGHYLCLFLLFFCVSFSVFLSLFLSRCPSLASCVSNSMICSGN